jgi:hypothetical protein
MHARATVYDAPYLRRHSDDASSVMVWGKLIKQRWLLPNDSGADDDDDDDGDGDVGKHVLEMKTLLMCKKTAKIGVCKECQKQQVVASAIANKH